MKKYEYVTITCQRKIGKGVFDAHRKIIDEYAARGYRYVGFVPTKQTNTGYLVEIDLVFEQDIEENTQFLLWYAK